VTDTAVAPSRLLDGRYELHEVIGEGTFGRVYRGFDRRLARPVAVKLIKPWWTEDPEWAERFEREAQLMARLAHPGIVQIHDVGQAEEGAYYVAELVEGESLAHRLRRGALSAGEAADVAEQFCRALAHAHARRVVHRDVKPENVLLQLDGRVKVGDFGVARLAEATSEARVGTVLGTPHYMAPEQARGQSPTPASDVYGAGVVLYEMLAGRPPFTAPSALELALRHATDPPPALPGHVPETLAQIVGRALAKEPHARYSTAKEMADALAGAPPPPDASTSAGATPASTPRGPEVTPVAPRGPAATRVAPRRGPRRNVNPGEARRYRTLWALVLVVLASLILGAVLSSGGNERVPRLLGLHAEAARAKLRHRDLRLRIGHRYAAAPAGTVISQRPAAGARAADGSTVDVVVSAGPPPVALPQLLGHRSVDAVAILSRLGLIAHVTRVAAPGVTPGLVVQQSPGATKPAIRGSEVTLSVAEVPRWRPLRSFSGDGSGQSGVIQIRGSRWRLVYGMGYDGTCQWIFFCSGPSARIINAASGQTVDQFSLNEGDNQTRVLSSGPGAYQISVMPGSDGAHWQLQIQDDY